MSAKQKPTDFNDMHQAQGKAAVAASIAKAVPVTASAESSSGPSTWQRSRPAHRGASSLVIRRASDVKPEPINWLWPGKIAIGKLTLIAGDPGLGKSMLTVNLAAHVSTGLDWPARGGSCPLGDVLFVSAEDDPADTIRPRLDAAKADPARIHIVAGVESLNSNGEPERRLLSLRKDLVAVAAAVRGLDACRLIVVDPVSAYLDGADSHNNSEVRGLLAPLSELAREVGAAMVAVTHLNKGSGASALYRTTGSLAFVAAARAAWLVTRDKINQDRRLFLPLKNNLGPDTTGMSYSIKDTAGVPFVQWDDEPVSISADDALGKPEDEDHESTLAEDAAEWLREVLAGGPVPAKEVMTHGSNAGYSAATIRRAQASIGIKPKRLGGAAGDGKWVWSLPEGKEGHQMSLDVSAND